MSVDRSAAWRRQLDEWLWEAREGRLEPEARAALNALLRRDPEARRHARRTLQNDGVLEEELRLERVERVFEEEPLWLESARRAASPRPWLARYGSWVAVLLVVLGVASLWTGREGGARGERVESTSAGIAVLSRSLGAEWEGALGGPRAGELLEPGWLRLRSGTVQLEFLSGATLVVEGPAELELVSRVEGVLRRGKVYGRVPGPAGGFRMRGGDFELEAGESNFGVVVGEGDVAKVLLWEGDGMLKSAGAGEWKRMEKGMALRVERGVAFADVGGAEEFFTTPRVLEERLAQGMTRRLEWWRASLRQAPPEDVLVHYAFEEMAGRELGNRGWVGGEAARGWIVGSPWVEGRWPGKGALDFKRVSDRVRIRVPGEWDAITWMAWVRVDSLPNALHGLVLDGAAHLHWQITGAGELQLGAAHGKGRERGVSPPVITPERFGQWLHLASSFDGRNGRICHYFNGERVSEHRVTPGVKLRLSEADIGNWTPEASRGGHAVRNLNGRMDELLLVRRALDPEEVRRHFQSGDPAYLPPVTGAIR